MIVYGYRWEKIDVGHYWELKVKCKLAAQQPNAMKLK